MAIEDIAPEESQEQHERKLSPAERLEQLNKDALHPSGPEGEEKQHARGKLTARERLDLLLDPGSFNELDKFATHRSFGFGMEERKYLGDGVVTGYGTVDGR